MSGKLMEVFMSLDKVAKNSKHFHGEADMMKAKQANKQKKLYIYIFPPGLVQ